MLTEELLQQRMEKLGLSDDFCRQCRLMGFGKLEDIVLLTPAELIGRAGFSYGWLAELTDFLEDRGLLHLLQTIPGKRPG